ncbi:hypothetical protein [Halorussus amylolyticus]|uniref:hypothetical protein n=1 Tax=Halorussus amylolyticus TaxID=1126242 RepID=UPI001047ACE9|nr:hypothetical protein [Halorussus amylolyticus]
MGSEKPSRRKVLKALGITASVTGTATYARASSPQTTQVPKLIAGGEVYEYMSVEKDWYEHTQHAAQARDRFSKQFRNNSSIFSIGLVRSPETYGGQSGLQIQVTTEKDELETLSNVLPNRFDEVPVTVGERPENKRKGNCTNTETNTNIQGGEAVGCKETSSYGTVCCPINSDELLHCAHVFWSSCDDNSSDIEGRTARVTDLNGTVQNIGTVEFADKKGDFIRITPYSDVSVDNTIDDNDVYPPIRGLVTKATLDRWVSKSKSDRPMLNHMGVNTGKTNGRLASVNYEESLTCTNFDDGHGVYTWVDMGDGDSGGPTYWYDGEYAWITNITTDYYYAYDTGCNDGWIGTDSCGTGAYQIADYGITFGDDLGT